MTWSRQVDDFRDTIESVDLLTGGDRRAIFVTGNIAHAPKLFGLSVFEVSLHVHLYF